MATRSMPFWPRPATTSGSSWPGSGLCALCSGPLSGSSDTAAAPLPHQLKRLNSLFHRRPARVRPGVGWVRGSQAVDLQDYKSLEAENAQLDGSSTRLFILALPNERERNSGDVKKFAV